MFAASLGASGCASGGNGDYGGGSDIGDDGGTALADGSPADDGGGASYDGASSSDTSANSDTGNAGDDGATADTGNGNNAIDSGASTGTDGSTGTGTDASVTGQKTIFVTSVVYSGNLGGLAGADSDCQTLAAAANLPGTYKAWLSDGTATAAARLTHSSGAYVLVDGTAIASGWTQLASGALLNPINETERGGAAAPGTASGQACFGAACAWTDTNADGTLAQGSFSCQNWSSQSSLDNAVLGETTSTIAYWSSFATSSGICDMTAPLYCVEQ